MRIPICFAADAAYARPLAVAISSILHSRAEDDELLLEVACNDSDVMLACKLMRCFFYIGIGCLSLLGINYADISYILAAALAALSFICIEYYY